MRVHDDGQCLVVNHRTGIRRKMEKSGYSLFHYLEAVGLRHLPRNHNLPQKPDKWVKCQEWSGASVLVSFHGMLEFS